MSILKSLRSPSGIMMIEAGLVALISFSTFTVLMRMIPIEAFGLWALISSFLNFARVADFWSRGLLSFVGEARGADNQIDAASYVSTTVIISAAGYLMLAAVMGGGIYFFAGSLSAEVDAAKVREIVPIMIATFCVLSTSMIYLISFVGFGKPIYRLVQTVGSALLFFLCTVLLVPGWGLWGVLVAQLIQACFALCFGAIVFHSVIARHIPAPLWNRTQSRALVSFGSKATVVMSVQLAIEPIIRGLTNLYGGLAAVAVVDITSRLVVQMRTFIGAVSPLLIAGLARRDDLGSEALAESKRSYGNMNRLFPLLTIAAYSMLLSAGPMLEEIIFGRGDTGFIIFLFILSIAWGANITTVLAYSLLVGRRLLRPLFITHLILTVGSFAFGILGGEISGINSMLAGVAVGFVTSSIYIAIQAGKLLGVRPFSPIPFSAVIPLAIASASVFLMSSVDVASFNAVPRFFVYSVSIGLTLSCCLRYSRVSEIAALLGAIRV